jgi:GT2 family glycosyltransferase
VILPYYDAPEALVLTLAGLGEQTYPNSLLQIVVVDDGSALPPEIPGFAEDLNLEIVRQERRGFRLARARNLGAATAEHEILVFLDCDMIPERRFVAAHARWHTVVSDAISIGFRRHADFRSVEPEDLRHRVRTDSIVDLFKPEDVQRPEWIEEHLERTDLLRARFDDVFRVMSGGNLGIRRSFFNEVGGNDETFDQWGGEDNEFGFRAYQHGAIVVPERRAVAWHQGAGHIPTKEERRSQIEQRAKMVHLVADPRFRRSVPGRSYKVPMATVELTADGATGEETVRCVESVLGGEFHDLVVLVELPSDHPDRVRVLREFDGEPRVVLGTEPAAERLYPNTPVRVRMTPRCRFGPETVGLIVKSLGAHGVGALHLTIPEITARDVTVEAHTTRALSRARRLASNDGDVDRQIGSLFGERWAAGADFGIHPAEAASADRWRDLSAEDRVNLELEAEVERLSTALGRVRSRRAVRLADGLGRLRAARSGEQLRATLKDVFAILFR